LGEHTVLEMLVIPYKFVARVNYRPLARDDVLARLDPAKVLKDVQREILKSIRSKIRQGAFSPRAKKALAKGLNTKIGPNSLTVVAIHPAFLPLIMGQRSGQMRWLRKATRPIPIVLDSGEVIFRSATAKSMRDGKWIHPGRPSSRIVDKARVEARKIVLKRIKKELQKQFRAGMK
jgi:hypothetical protein